MNKFFYLFSFFALTHSVYAMELQNKEFDTHPQLCKKIKTKNVKKLTVIAAKTALNSVSSPTIDETNLDEVAQTLVAVRSSVGNDPMAHIHQQLAYEQPFPYFSTFPVGHYLTDISPDKAQKTFLTFKPKEFFVIDQEEKRLASFNASFDNQGMDNVKFLGNNYLSYIRHTRKDGPQEYVLSHFQDETWQPVLTIAPHEKIIDASLSDDTNTIALALTNEKVVFWQRASTTEQWEQSKQEIDLKEFIDTLLATVYKRQDRHSRPFKFTNMIQEHETCTSISSIAFLPNSSNTFPSLLLGLASSYNKHPNEGILTLWHYKDGSWQLQEILPNKHDWPIVAIRPSADGNRFLTHTYSSRHITSYITCWEKNNDHEWKIIKKSKQQRPTPISASFNPTHNSFIQHFQSFDAGENSFIQQFSFDEHSCKKIRKISIDAFNLKPAFPVYYEWKTNTSPILWLNNNEIAIGNSIILLNPSINYALCQKALRQLTLKKRNTRKNGATIDDFTLVNPTTESNQDQKFYNCLKTFMQTKTFSQLSFEEKKCLISYLQRSIKFIHKTRKTPEIFAAILSPYCDITSSAHSTLH